MLGNATGTYRGRVTAVNDPTNSNRIKFQCPQIAGDAELQWAEPANYLDPIPKPGDLVWIYFNGGDTTKPVYSITSNPYSWILPTYLTGWTGNNIFNGLGGPTLKIRKTLEDEVYLYGNTKATSTNNFILTLPFGFFNPTGGGMSGYVMRNNAGTISMMNIAVDISLGTLILATAPVANNEFLFNIKIPMQFVA